MTSDSDTQQVAGPFTDIIQQAFTLVWDVTSGNIPGDLHWQRLLLMTVFAVAIFVFYRGHGSKGADGRERKVGLLAFLLPEDIYTHVSARVDIWLWVLERLLRPVWAVALFATVGPATEQTVIAVLISMFGTTPALEINYAWMLLYSLVLFDGGITQATILNIGFFAFFLV